MDIICEEEDKDKRGWLTPVNPFSGGKRDVFRQDALYSWFLKIREYSFMHIFWHDRHYPGSSEYLSVQVIILCKYSTNDNDFQVKGYIRLV